MSSSLSSLSCAAFSSASLHTSSSMSVVSSATSAPPRRKLSCGQSPSRGVTEVVFDKYRWMQQLDVATKQQIGLHRSKSAVFSCQVSHKKESKVNKKSDEKHSRSEAQSPVTRLQAYLGISLRKLIESSFVQTNERTTMLCLTGTDEVRSVTKEMVVQIAKLSALQSLHLDGISIDSADCFEPFADRSLQLKVEFSSCALPAGFLSNVAKIKMITVAETASDS